MESFSPWPFATDSFTEHHVFQVHACCSRCQDFIPFYCQIIFHCVDGAWFLKTPWNGLVVYFQTTKANECLSKFQWTRIILWIRKTYISQLGISRMYTIWEGSKFFLLVNQHGRYLHPALSTLLPIVSSALANREPEPDHWANYWSKQDLSF